MSKTNEPTIWCSCGTRIRVAYVLRHVDKRESDECWPWALRIGDKGYGRVCHMTAHRAVYMCMVRDPGPLFVLHSCDNRPCCNWERHLRAGTAKENYNDAATRKRTVAQLPGARSLHAKLTRKQVDEIRRLYTNGEHTQRALARQFGLSQSGVYSIVNHHTWV